MRGCAKEIKDLIEEIQDHGVADLEGGTKHVKVIVRGRVVSTLPLTPSDPRSAMNSRLYLERLGVIKRKRQGTGSKRGRRYVVVQPASYKGPRYPWGRQPRD